MSLMRMWHDNWNDVIRNVIFEDEELKELMMVDKDISIIEFVDRYFIRAGYSNKVLKDEKVRIVYSEIQPLAQNQYITRNVLCFDIYVNLDCIHNVSNDRLRLRTQAIAERLYDLLTQNRYVEGFRFWIIGESDLGTKTVGYARYNMMLGYLRTY